MENEQIEINDKLAPTQWSHDTDRSVNRKISTSQGERPEIAPIVTLTAETSSTVRIPQISWQLCVQSNLWNSKVNAVQIILQPEQRTSNDYKLQIIKINQFHVTFI